MYMFNGGDPFDVRTILTTSNDTATAGVTLSGWAGIQTGDMIVVLCCVNVSQTPATSSSGWTKVGNAQASGSDGVLCAFAGIHGTAASSLVLTWSSSHCAFIIYAISGATANTSDVKIGTATGGFTAYDPPSLNPSQGSTPKIWIAAAGASGGTKEPTAAPSGFGTFTAVECNATGGSGSAHVSFGSAHLLDSASTKDPGTFTSPTDVFWSALTVSVLGA